MNCLKFIRLCEKYGRTELEKITEGKLIYALCSHHSISALEMSRTRTTKNQQAEEVAAAARSAAEAQNDALRESGKAELPMPV